MSPWVTPDFPELSRFEITPAVTDHIEQAALWLASNAELSPAGRIGLMGISVSGGLSIVAAVRSALHNRLSYLEMHGLQLTRLQAQRLWGWT
jgi:hypothetical protein